MPTDQSNRLSVLMLDLASIVPYYTGHLTTALVKEGGVELEVGSINYHLDPGYFERQGVSRCSNVLDVVSKLSIRSAKLRQGLKAVEYMFNLFAVLGRCLLTRPDVVHIQFLPLFATRLPFERWFLQALHLAGLNIVYTVHNMLPHDTGKRHHQRYENLYRMMDGLICHDEAACVRLTQEFQVDPRKVKIIPHGPLFDQTQGREAAIARKALGLPEDGLIVLCQGILRPYKGVDVLLDAWRAVHAANAAATLVIVGAGTEDLQNQIQDSVHEFEISSSVRLDLRFVSASELADYYSAADILVYPYREITSSGSLMTGINRGKGIVASRLAAFEEILSDGENALLVAPGDALQLATALQLLIGDAKLRSRLASYETPAGPQWPTIAQETIRAYADAAVRPQKATNGQKALTNRSS